ncbi:hypothetical protein [Aliikangiella maris]|uniref:Uncharacterized protein n=2 Tax=Aliikangiella maris TaxID=3162458 RepID=A0ABV3MV91_9GAMM
MRANKKTYLYHYWIIVLFLVLALVLPRLIELFISSKLHENTIIFIEFALICPAILAMILFVQYYSLSKNLKVKYFDNKVFICSGETKKSFEISDVQQLRIKYSIPVYFKGFRYFPTDSFMYALIYLRSGERFLITSFLDLELLDTIRFFEGKVNVVKKPTLMCWPPKQN